MTMKLSSITVRCIFIITAVSITGNGTQTSRYHSCSQQGDITVTHSNDLKLYSL